MLWNDAVMVALAPAASFPEVAERLSHGWVFAAVQSSSADELLISV